MTTKSSNWHRHFVGQLHEEAWYRFVILSLIAVGIYAGYGQYNAAPSSSDHHSSIGYHGVPSEAP
jgi:APA family basic amino acid/polyamine antiporter